MPRVIRPYFSSTERAQIWKRWRAGEPIWRISRALERRSRTICDELDRGGGFSPRPRRRALRSLSEGERVEISRGLAAQRSLRSMAHGLCRTASSISREVRRNGGAGAYRAGRADQRAWDLARRPKVCRSATAPEAVRVRGGEAAAAVVAAADCRVACARLPDRPQYAGVARDDLPDAVRAGPWRPQRELTAHLRSHRKRRGAHHAEGAGARSGSIVGELSSANGRPRPWIARCPGTGRAICCADRRARRSRHWSSVTRAS